MTRVAVLGANGQVGAEVCLILRNHPDVIVIPVVRNRFGSAFLRHRGVGCRHGLPAAPNQAPALIGDCNVIVNLALAVVPGRPRQARRLNRTLIEHSIRYSAPGARVIYFSTLMVHGDARPEARVRWRSAYGQEKRAGERDALRFAKRYDKEVYVLRLGHVCGELQNITTALRQDLANPPVAIPAEPGPSNTVYTATIVDAILSIAHGRQSPGVYDLVCSPQWTWCEVYEYEAACCGLVLQLERLSTNATGRARAKDQVRRLVSAVADSERSKQWAIRLVSRLSLAMNHRIQALFYKSRVAREVAELAHPSRMREELSWIDLCRNPLPGLRNTSDLLSRPEYGVPALNPEASWPPDPPQASPTQPESSRRRAASKNAWTDS